MTTQIRKELSERFRYWLAEKIIGKPIRTVAEVKAEFEREQLESGNTVTLSYIVSPAPIQTHGTQQ